MDDAARTTGPGLATPGAVGAPAPVPPYPYADIPTVEEIRAYVKVPASVLSEDDLTRMRWACIADQWARCLWTETTYTDALAQALLRRVQREIAARNLPLGMVGLEAEYGPANIPAFDALIEHHEHPYRRVVLA